MPDIVINPSLGKIDFFTVKGEQVTNSMTFVGGNMGIGTTVPSASLHINSTTAGATLLRTDGTNGTLFSVVDDLSDSLMSVNNSAGLPVLEVFADDRIVGGQYGQNDFVLINNKVGIGTNNPIGKLHVTGSSSVPAAIFIGNVGIGTTVPADKLSIVSGNISLSDNYKLYDGSSNDSAGLYFGSSQVNIAGYSGIIFRSSTTNISGQTERMRITNAGNVGIGTSSPANKLDVVGNILINGASNSNIAQLVFTRTDVSWGIFNETNLRFYSSGSNTISPSTLRMTITSDGNVGIGTASPGYTLEVNGTQRTAGNFYLFNTVVNPATNFSNQRGVGFEASTGKLEVAASASTALAIGRFGSTGQILDFRYESTQIGNFSLDTNDLTLATARHLILSPTGNVGIGTTSPVTQLHVSGSLQIGNGTNYGNKFTLYDDFSSGKLAYVMRDLNSDDIFGLYCNSTTGEVRFLADDDDANTAFMTFQTNASERMRITNAGNVGIGTTSPTINGGGLHVYGSGQKGIRISGNSSNSYSVEIGCDATKMSYIQTVGTADRGLQLYTGNASTVVMTLTGSNVGIGTTVPTAKLQIGTQTYGTAPDATYFVVGNDDFSGPGPVGAISGYPTAANKNQVTASIFDVVSGWEAVNGSHAILRVSAYNVINSTPAFVVLCNGNVGIGTTNPGGKLEIRTNDASTYIFSGTSTSGYTTSFTMDDVASYIGHDSSVRSLTLRTNSADRLTIKGDGNVGIGTTVPVAKLDVSGDLRISGSGSTVGTFKSSASSCFISLIDSSNDNVFLGNDDGDFLIQTPTTSYSTKLIVKDDGNVGIGTTLPASRLHVDKSSQTLGSSTPSGATIISNLAGHNAILELGVDTTNFSYIQSRNVTDQTYYKLLLNPSGGSVGIGTSSPVAALDVSRLEYPSLGGVLANFSAGTTDPTTEKYVILKQTYTGAAYDSPMLVFKANANSVNSGSFGIVRTTSNGSIVFSNVNATSGTVTAVSEKMRITADGLVGIGTTSPATKLYVVSSGSPIARFDGSSVASSGATEIDVLGPQSNGDLNLGVGGSTFTDDTNNIQNKGYVTAAGGLSALNLRSDSGYVQITTGGITSANERMRITSGGNVGIGTTTPLAQLHVASTTAGATLLRTDGTSGTLFSVVDDLSDSLMSVNNSAGLPVLEVFADDRIVAGQYGQNDFVVVNNKVGIGTNNPVAKLHVTGSSSVPAAVFMGNVGIGTTSFIYSNANRGDIEVYGSTDALISLRNGTANSYLQKSGNDFYFNNGGAGFIAISTNGSERMQITSDGNLYLGTSTTSVTNGGIVSYASSIAQFAMGHATGVASGTAYAGFQYNGTQIGSITQNGTTGVLYNTTSDYRLKEDIQPLSSGLVRINSLKPSVYTWKSDGSNGEGFMAHELAEVVPLAVTGQKDAVNDDGSINPQSVDMSKVVPILVAAIQELSVKVKTLEAKVQILESK